MDKAIFISLETAEKCLAAMKAENKFLEGRVRPYSQRGDMIGYVIQYADYSCSSQRLILLERNVELYL